MSEVFMAHLTTAASMVVYKDLEENQSITLEDIWLTTALGQLPQQFQRIKKDLERQSQLDQEAINPLLHCPNDQRESPVCQWDVW